MRTTVVEQPNRTVVCTTSTHCTKAAGGLRTSYAVLGTIIQSRGSFLLHLSGCFLRLSQYLLRCSCVGSMYGWGGREPKVLDLMRDDGRACLPPCRGRCSHTTVTPFTTGRSTARSSRPAGSSTIRVCVGLVNWWFVSYFTRVGCETLEVYSTR